MTVRIGQTIPDITVPAYVRGGYEPEPINVAEQRGAWTVLFFYPRDFTFVCPTELAAFAELHEAFLDANAILLAASTDSWWVHRAWFSSDPLLAGVQYPVLADTGHELSRALGVLEDDGACVRATFIIDSDGMVRHSSATDLSVGRSAEETLRLLQALQTGELCPAGWRPGQETLQAA